MVSYKVLMQIRLRLLDIMDLLFHFQESTFWNLVIFFQLKPVLGSYISTKQPPAFHLWTDLFEVVKLENNERQISDVQCADLLTCTSKNWALNF